MKPTIGRIVHFYFAAGAPLRNGSRVHPAVVTAVHSDTCVNLTVFVDDGAVERHTSQLLGANAGEPQHWEWPPLTVEPKTPAAAVRAA